MSRIKSSRSKLRKNLLFIRKRIKHLGEEAVEFLTPKYWLIYLVAFFLGFYLFGPAHGWQNLSKATFNKSIPKEDSNSIITLQREIKILKNDLLKLSNQAKKVREFSPDQIGKPASGKIIQKYQWAFSNNIWRLHSGVDIGMPLGSNIMAAADGDVISSEETGNSFMVTISHGNEWQTVYSNLAKIFVKAGEKVRKGQVIGLCGMLECLDNGQPGFHFAIYREKEPVDPEKIIAGLN